jgi:opacity protein-like surface antigen
MKKTLPLIAIAGLILLSSEANAKTEGNYLGIDLVRSSAQVKSNSNLASDQIGLAEFYDHKKDDAAYGFGINYKYAFNFNNFFVAPGVSYSVLNNDVKAGFAGHHDDPYSQNLKLKSQLTVQANLGYDITDQFAAYIPVGVSSFEYELKTSDDGSIFILDTKKSDRESALFFGLGFSYQPVKNWVMNLEYNKFQNFKVTSPVATVNGGQIVADVNVDVLKFGVAYQF